MASTGPVTDLVVMYKRGDRVVGKTRRALSDHNTACVTKFRTNEAAARFFEAFDNRTIPCFGNVMWLNENKVLVDDGFEVFDATQRLNFDIWRYNAIQTEIISMSWPFVKFLRGVITGLRSINACNKAHRNLLNGITLSRNLDVKLFNIRDTQDALEVGIQKDLSDLTELVRTIVIHNPHDNQFRDPTCLDLFLDFQRMLSTITLDPSIDVQKWEFDSYFTYINPIFADDCGRMILIKKFCNLRELMEDKLDKEMEFNDPPARMAPWFFRVPYGTYIHQRLMKTMSTFCSPYESKPKRSVIHFYKVCLRHKDEPCPMTNQTLDEVAIEEDLLQALPDVLPMIFYEFVRKIACTKLDDPTFLTYIKFFRGSDPKIIA